LKAILRYSTPIRLLVPTSEMCMYVRSKETPEISTVNLLHTHIFISTYTHTYIHTLGGIFSILRRSTYLHILIYIHTFAKMNYLVRDEPCAYTVHT